MKFKKLNNILKYRKNLPKYLEYCNALYAKKAIWDIAYGNVEKQFLAYVIKGEVVTFNVRPLSYGAWTKAKPVIEPFKLYYVDGALTAMTEEEYLTERWLRYLMKYGIAIIDSSLQEGKLKPSNVVDLLKSKIKQVR